MRLGSSRLATAALGLIAACIPLTLTSAAEAAVTAVTVSPAAWTPGSSQGFTVTLQITGSVTYVGFMENNGTRTWTLSQTGTYDGTLSGNTLTCATSGVTYTSSMFSTWGDGVKTNACYDDQDRSWFEVGASIAGASASGPGTIVITVPAGLLTAPTAEGTTVLKAFGIPDPTLTFNGIVATAVVAPTAAITPQSHLQAVGMPGSGACDDVDDEQLAWGTGLTGGWQRSWGQWLHDGLGGWACSRTLSNVAGTERWAVAEG